MTQELAPVYCLRNVFQKILDEVMGEEVGEWRVTLDLHKEDDGDVMVTATRQGTGRTCCVPSGGDIAQAVVTVCGAFGWPLPLHGPATLTMEAWEKGEVTIITEGPNIGEMVWHNEAILERFTASYPGTIHFWDGQKMSLEELDPRKQDDDIEAATRVAADLDEDEGACLRERMGAWIDPLKEAQAHQAEVDAEIQAGGLVPDWNLSHLQGDETRGLHQAMDQMASGLSAREQLQQEAVTALADKRQKWRLQNEDDMGEDEISEGGLKISEGRLNFALEAGKPIGTPVEGPRELFTMESISPGAKDGDLSIGATEKRVEVPMDSSTIRKVLITMAICASVVCVAFVGTAAALAYILAK